VWDGETLAALGSVTLEPWEPDGSTGVQRLAAFHDRHGRPCLAVVLEVSLHIVELQPASPPRCGRSVSLAALGLGDLVTALAGLGATTGRVVAGSSDGAIAVWDAATGEVVHRLQGHRDGSLRPRIQAVATYTEPAGGRLRFVTASASGDVSVWDAETGELVRDMTLEGEGVRCLAGYAGDQGRQVLVTGSAARVEAGELRVRLWDAEDGRLLHALDPPFLSGVQSLQVFTTGTPDDGRYHLAAVRPHDPTRPGLTRLASTTSCAVWRDDVCRLTRTGVRCDSGTWGRRQRRTPFYDRLARRNDHQAQGAKAMGRAFLMRRLARLEQPTDAVGVSRVMPTGQAKWYRGAARLAATPSPADTPGARGTLIIELTVQIADYGVRRPPVTTPPPPRRMTDISAGRPHRVPA
jgi:hypothetical protein